jgi:hypothetical protein
VGMHLRLVVPFGCARSVYDKEIFSAAWLPERMQLGQGADERSIILMYSM